MKIHPLHLQDIPVLPSLQPPHWSDLRIVFRSLFPKPWFQAIKVIKDGEIVGIGQNVYTPTSAWLGNIIVHKNCRNQGIGRKITEHLIHLAKAEKKQFILLLATEEGERVYQKLNFQRGGIYAFYRKKENYQLSADSTFIFNSHLNDFPSILDLDKKTTGEDRSNILEEHLPHCLVYKKEEKGRVLGFYMPDLGEGLVIAETPEAGLELLKLRSEKMGVVVLPAHNIAGVQWLEQQGYECFNKQPMMYLGKMKEWKPEMLFSRIKGYLG